ncbi:cysteine and histidine-rich domain-containing protein RAR1 isoform X2 [Aristolochia californica]
MKEWSCCKQRNHDFSLFLTLPGCKVGKHTTEKPLTTAVKKPTPPPVAAKAKTDVPKIDCSRCRQGFFCSDHDSQPSSMNAQTLKPCVTPPEKSNEDVNKSSTVSAKRVIDLNAPQTCRNKGCGKTFKEKDNHAEACEYHPGPAVFHDRLRGWKCCDIHVKEFDEFMNIPPCTKGWHNADPVS